MNRNNYWYIITVTTLTLTITTITNIINDNNCKWDNNYNYNIYNNCIINDNCKVWMRDIFGPISDLYDFKCKYRHWPDIKNYADTHYG